MHSWWIHIMWEVELARTIQDSSSFTICLPVVSWSPVPSRAFVMCSSPGLSIMHQHGWLFLPPSFTGSQTWVSNITGGRRFIRGQLPYLIQWVRSKGWDHLKANLGFGYSGLSLPPGYRLSSANLLYMEDFLQSVPD